MGEMMTLGKYDAAVSPSFVEGVTMEGPIGHIGKLRIYLLLSIPFPILTCWGDIILFVNAARKLAYLIRLPTDEHRVKVGFSWFAKSVVESVASVQDNIVKVLSN